MQTQRCRGAAAPGGWPGALVSQESLPWLCSGWDSEGQSLPSGCTSAGPGSRAAESPGHCSRPRLLPGPWRSAHSRAPLNTSGHPNRLEPPPPGPLCAPALVTLGKHCCSARWPSQDLLSPEQINGSVLPSWQGRSEQTPSRPSLSGGKARGVWLRSGASRPKQLPGLPRAT